MEEKQFGFFRKMQIFFSQLNKNEFNYQIVTEYHFLFLLPLLLLTTKNNEDYTRAAKRPEVIIQAIRKDEVRNISDNKWNEFPG